MLIVKMLMIISLNTIKKIVLLFFLNLTLITLFDVILYFRSHFSRQKSALNFVVILFH